MKHVIGKSLGIKYIVLVTGVRRDSYSLLHREPELIRCKRFFHLAQQPPSGPRHPHSRGF